MRIITNESSDSPWFLYEGMEFQIGYVEDEKINSLSKSAIEIGFNKKHQRTEEVNPIKFNKAVAKKALLNWRGVKRKDLRKLIEPSKKLYLDEGESWEDKLEYSEDTKSMIIEYMHNEFGTFIGLSSRDVESYIKAEAEKEERNLGSGSAGGDPQAD